MRRFNHSFLAVLLLACLQTGSVWARVDTVRSFPQSRFVDGPAGFYKYLASTLRYPLQAQQSATVGTSLVSFILTPAGKLTNVAIVNSLGKYIDREMVRIIQETDKLWLPANGAESQDSLMMFLPIRFLLNDFTFYVESVKPDFIMDEAVVVGYDPTIRYALKDDADYVTAINSAAQKKDYKRMLGMVNELIRRNPYSDKLYLQRANLKRELGLPEEACRDYKKIIYFLGKTHLPKQFLTNCSESTNPGIRTTLVQSTERYAVLNEIFTVSEVSPSFPGGSIALNEYIEQNLRYPEAALKKKIQGKVLVSFIVTKDGHTQDVSVLEGLGFGADEEAVRLILNMPDWNPGMQRGRVIDHKYNLVIPFKLKDAK